MFKWFKNHGNTQIIRNDAMTIDSRSFWIQYYCGMGFSVLQGANTLNSSIWTVLSFWWRHCLWSAKTTIFSCKYDEIDRTISNEFYFVYFSISSQFPRTLRWKWFVLGIQRIRRNYGTRTDQTHAYHRSHIQPLSHCFFSFFLAAQNADRQREGGI